jgi:hypothetical protein
MWCKNCRQDTPGIATPETGVVHCAKCRQELTEPSGGESPSKAEESNIGVVPEWAFVESPPLDLDSWQWDSDLHEARRLVRSFGSMHERHAAKRADQPPKPWVPPRDPSREPARTPPAKRTAKPRSLAIQFLAWSALSLGIMALVFGGVLLAWSCWSGHQKLWTLGLPFALGGQAALILGLVLQLDGVWQSSRDAATALNQLDEQVDELRHATTMLTSSHGGHAQSFYFHLAEGASPHMLLADLKGQLDLLAMRMAQESGS